MADYRNIVQAEFFLVNTRGASSDQELLGEIRGRREDGAPIKTTVRFHDEGGFVTEFAQELARLEEGHKILQTKFLAARGLWRRWLFSRFCRAVKKIDAEMARVKVFAADQLHTVAETHGSIAIEQSDHSFRPLQADEVHELLEAADRAKGAWIFVFGPTDLLADKLPFVASIMWDAKVNSTAQ